MVLKSGETGSSFPALPSPATQRPPPATSDWYSALPPDAEPLDAYGTAIDFCYASNRIRNLLVVSGRVDGLSRGPTHGPCYA